MKSKKFRFVVVGGTNTVVDFAILNGLAAVGLPKIAANTASTGLAMTLSFFMNKKWTFNSASKNYLREVVLFIIFTLFGLWVIQNGAMWLILTFAPHFGLPDWVFLNLAKVIASAPSLIWNYLSYNRFVFKEAHGQNRD
jgi:putative flippase GtrA